jgi:N-alpha-acetyltransferase 38, NatC auxiliary subunit
MPSEKARTAAMERAAAGEGTSTANMTSRFVGLIVVPGNHLVKLELEEKLGQPWEGDLTLRSSKE